MSKTTDNLKVPDISKTAEIIGKAIFKSCEEHDISPLMMNFVLVKVQAMMQLSLVLCAPESERASLNQSFKVLKEAAEKDLLEGISEEKGTCH